MRLKITVLAVLFGALSATCVHAQGAGRSLDIQPGARWNGMGAWGVAMADDASGATWWNPAGLGFAERNAVELTYAQLVPDLVSDVSYNYGIWVHPVEGWGAFGLGIIFLSYGTSERTDRNGIGQGTFTSNEFSPALSYGTRLLPDLSVGATVKFIRVQLAEASDQGIGSTFGLDLGGLYKIPIARLNLGVNVQNLGPSLTFISEDQASPLSRNIRAGAAWEPVKTKLFTMLIGGDFNQSLVTPRFRVYNGGAELRYTEELAGRIGYYYDPLGDIKDVTYGLGVSWKALTLDFGSIPQATGLDHVKKITLGYRF